MQRIRLRHEPLLLPEAVWENSANKMPILQLMGILVVVNTLTCAAWFVLRGKNLSAGIVSLILISTGAGLILAFRGRADEIASIASAKIQSAEQQAAADARQIAALRERIEAQSVVMDSATREAAEAQSLLDRLKQENQNADDKLKLLLEKTSAVSVLPDGRILAGTSIVGLPERFIETRTRMTQSYEHKDYEAAYAAAQSCIQMFEETQSAKPSALSSMTGELSAEEIAVLYGVGAEMALRFSDHDKAVEWAQKADSASSSAEGKFTLVAALVGARKSDQALEVINETLSHKGGEADKFKALLQVGGLLKARN